MNIELLNKPFEHIIIRDACTDDQLDRIYLEVDFLSAFIKQDTKFSFDNDSMVEYNPRQDGGVFNYGETVHLNKTGIFFNTFTNQFRNSESYKTIRYLLNQNKYDVKQHNLMTGYLNSDKCMDFSLLVSYYENGSFYNDHYDTAILTSLLYLKPFGDCYTGGNLIFQDFDYEFVPTDNSMIIFPSFIWHRVNKISTERDGVVRIALTAFIGN